MTQFSIQLTDSPRSVEMFVVVPSVCRDEDETNVFGDRDVQAATGQAKAGGGQRRSGIKYYHLSISICFRYM